MTVSETFGAGRAADADKYLTAAVEAVKLRPSSTSYNGIQYQPDRKEDDPIRQLLALAGVGQAILALGDRLADVADAVTGVQTQVGVLCDAAEPPRQRRWWGRGRSAARPALAPTDMALIRQALADAASWCRVDECSAP